MNLETLRKQIRKEQLRYLYNNDIPDNARSLQWYNGHIPKEYIFNSKRRRLAGVPHAQDYLYCKPFFVWHKHKKYYSHMKDGQFVREALPVLPETEAILTDLARMVLSKCKYDYRYQQDLFADAYCALLQKFREVDTNRSATQVFNYVISIGINAIKNVNSKHREWDYFHHTMWEPAD